MHVTFIFLLLFGIAFAAPINLMFAVPMVAIIVVIFLAIMFMFSNALSSPQLMAWTKSEFREFVAGVLLVIIIFSLFISAEQMSAVLMGEEEATYIDASIGVIDNMLESKTSGYDTAYENIIRVATKIRVGATYSPYVGIPAWYFYITYSASPLSGASIFLMALGSATQGLTNVIFLYEGLSLLIKFFHATVPTIILPLAFAIRLIPFTRRIGNTLIAVSLAAIVLLPFSVIIVGEVNKQLIDYPNVTISDSDMFRLDPHSWSMDFGSMFCSFLPNRFLLAITEYGFGFVCCGWLLLTGYGAAAFPACFELTSEVIYPVIMQVIKIVQTVLTLTWLQWAEMNIGATGGFGYGLWPERVFDILMPFLQNVNNVILVGYIDFVVIAIITISGAKSISTALGGEWYMAGVERLI